MTQVPRSSTPKKVQHLHGEDIAGELDGVVVGGQLDVIEAAAAVGVVERELGGLDHPVQRIPAYTIN